MDSIQQSKHHRTGQIVAIVMLLWALSPSNPYGYYILLRIIVCAVCGYTSFRSNEIAELGWAWVFGIAAVLYNPFIPIHLTRDLWSFLNIVTAILLFISIIRYLPPRNN